MTSFSFRRLAEFGEESGGGMSRGEVVRVSFGFMFLHLACVMCVCDCVLIFFSLEESRAFYASDVYNRCV